MNDEEFELFKEAVVALKDATERLRVVTDRLLELMRMHMEELKAEKEKGEEQ